MRRLTEFGQLGSWVKGAGCACAVASIGCSASPLPADLPPGVTGTTNSPLITVVTSHGYAFESGRYVVEAEVRNNTQTTLSGVRVLTTLYGQTKNFIASDVADIAIDPLPAGKVSPFKTIITVGDQVVVRHKIEFRIPGHSIHYK